jgi:hypothetical protein
MDKERIQVLGFTVIPPRKKRTVYYFASQEWHSPVFLGLRSSKDLVLSEQILRFAQNETNNPG